MTQDACSPPGRVLVTGNEGYIGSVLAPYLESLGYEVVGLDAGLFATCCLGNAPAMQTIRKDLRDVTEKDLRGFDAVVHLAALSNDPIGNLNPGWTRQINEDGSVRIAEMARSCGVGRFIFSSSCIMYGAADADVVDETSALDPKTEYARSKVAAEERIARLAGDDFSPVFLRNGTVYGYSPRMRLDTVLNSFVASALVYGCVVVHSNGKPWRPVVHVKDLVRTIALMLQAPRSLIHNQAFNNGCDEMNIQVGELAELAASAVADATVEINARADADQRTYRASFAKFAKTFPDFQFHWSPARGACDLRDDLVRLGFGRRELEGDQFVRLRWLRRQIEAAALDRDLRSTMEAPAG